MPTSAVRFRAVIARCLSLMGILIGLIPSTVCSADPPQPPTPQPPETKRPSATLPPANKPAAAPTPARPARPSAAISLEGIDASYWVQGEYFGQLRQGNLELPIGLQVVCLGNGVYQATEYFGGLPGNGWENGRRRARLRCQSEGEALVCSGPIHDFVLRGGEALIRNYRGAIVGSLPRVERTSSTLGAAPPAGAQVLFDGTSLESFTGGKWEGQGLLAAGATTKRAVGDFFLHLEFRTPYKPLGRGQDRGNSGVYIQTRYEVQILDSFGHDAAFDDCGALYRQRAPRINMCFPPLVWQTYDIDFTAVRFSAAGQKQQNARITVKLNGITIHDQVELVAKTGAGKIEGPLPLPILLQDHGNPVQFRNIWLIAR